MDLRIFIWAKNTEQHKDKKLKKQYNKGTTRQQINNTKIKELQNK